VGSFKPLEKKRVKFVEKCQTIMMALHIIATMFPKPHSIHRAKSIYTKITYSKLASFNSTSHNEGATKLKTFLKERSHNPLSENQKKTLILG